MIVLSNNDGCAIARTAEAKALGIRMGRAYFKLQAAMSVQRRARLLLELRLYGGHVGPGEHRLPAVRAGRGDLLDRRELPRPLRVRESRPGGAGDWISARRCGSGPACHTASGSGRRRRSPSSPTTSPRASRNSGACATCPTKPSAPPGCRDLGRRGLGIGARLAGAPGGLGVDTVADLRDLDPRPARASLTLVGERIIHELRGRACLRSRSCRPAPRTAR